MKAFITGTVLVLGILASGGLQAQGAFTTVRYADTSKSPLYSQYYVAQAKGYFSKHGLNVVAINVNAGAPVLAAMATGDIDVGGIAPPQAVLATMSGATIRIVAGGEVPVPYAAMARAGVNANSIKEFKGMKLGNVGPGTGFDAMTRFLLRADGLDPDKDVQLVNLGVTPGAWVSAFQNSLIDAAVVMVEPWISLVEDAKVGRKVVDLAKTGLAGVPNQMNTAFLGSGKWITEQADAARRFVAAINEANAFLNNAANRDEAVAIVNKGIGGDPKVARRTLDAIGSNWSTLVTQANIADTIKFMKATRMIPDNADLKYENLIAPGITPTK